MKNLVKTTVVILMVFCAVNVFAQAKVKLGHINSDSLLKLMPGRDSAIAKIQAEAAVYQKLLATMNSEYETKASEYQTNYTTLSELIKQTKLAELQDLQTRIEKFQTDASDSLQKKQTSLLQPIIDKAKKAIEEVAKENGFTYVFDSALGVILYSTETDDIMPLVKKKLGIK
ncbi:MAG TPA: OmpH family outer membrane protein [Bacteroidales bacterium]|nr:OmpH family outer membrane protein [Bacteroidales bacterium]HPS17993.1 OmpH family outer membrane protein [Bacteroidales bacterium]